MRAISARPHRIRSAAGAGAMHLAAPALTILITFAGVRLHGIEMWGRVVAYMLVAALAAALANWGQRDFVLREMALAPSEAIGLWQRNAVTRLALLGPATLAVAALALRLAMPGDGAAECALGLAYTAALVASRCFDAPLAREKAFAPGVAIDVMVTLLLAAGIAALPASDRPASLLAALTLAEIARTAARAWLFRAYLVGIGGTRITAQELWLGLSYFALSLSGMLSSRVDSYVVGILLPPASLSTYQIVTGMFGYVQIAAGVLALSTASQLVRMRPGAVLRLGLSNLALGVPIVVIAILLAPWLIALLYGVAIPPSLAIAAGLSGLPVFLYSPILVRCHRSGRGKWVVTTGLLATLVTAGAAVPLVSHLGLTGAQLASLLGGLFELGGALYLLRRM